MELTGVVDSDGKLHLDGPAALASGRVRVLVLWEQEEPSEAGWLHAIAAAPAFGFLRDDQEGIYSPEDGEPIGPTGTSRQRS